MIEHPYADLSGGRWLVGNLHAHTTASDGQRDHQDDRPDIGLGEPAPHQRDSCVSRRPVLSNSSRSCWRIAKRSDLPASARCSRAAATSASRVCRI